MLFLLAHKFFSQMAPIVGSAFRRSLLLSEWAQNQQAQYNEFDKEDGLKNWGLVRVTTTRYNHMEMWWSHTRRKAKVYPRTWSEDWFSFFPVLLCLTTETFGNGKNYDLPFPVRASCVIYLLSINLGHPFVDHAGCYLNAYPICRLPQLAVSCNRQGDAVQGSFPH